MGKTKKDQGPGERVPRGRRRPYEELDVDRILRSDHVRAEFLDDLAETKRNIQQKVDDFLSTLDTSEKSLADETREILAKWLREVDKLDLMEDVRKSETEFVSSLENLKLKKSIENKPDNLLEEDVLPVTPSAAEAPVGAASAARDTSERFHYEHMEFVHNEELYRKIVNNKLTGPLKKVSDPASQWQFGDPIKDIPDFLISVELINAIRRVAIKIIKGKELSDLDQKVAQAYSDERIEHGILISVDPEDKSVYSIKEALDSKKGSSVETELPTEAPSAVEPPPSRAEADAPVGPVVPPAEAAPAPVAPEASTIDQASESTHAENRAGKSFFDQAIELIQEHESTHPELVAEYLAKIRAMSELEHNSEEIRTVYIEFLDKLEALDGAQTANERINSEAATDVSENPVEPETPATPSVEPEVKSGNVTEEADFEVLPNDDNTERKADSEDNHEQEPQNLEEARLAWLKSLRKRGNLFKRDKLGSSNAVDVYKNFLQAKLVSNLESKQQELLAGMNPDTLDEAKIREIVEALASSHIALLQEEENQIDLLSSGLEQSSMQKFKALWRKYAKSRLVLGAGLFVGGAALTAATGGVGGLLAGILTARGMLSSAGTFLGAESFIDTRSKWGGQKGIIDEMKNLGYTFGGFNKFGIKIKASEASVISQEDVDYWAGKDGKPGRLEEKYSTDQLGQELARLRILSLDKGASIKDAARFGGEQEQFVKIIEAVYYKKLKEDLKQKLSSAGPLVAQSEIIQSTVQNNIEAEQNLLISEQDKSRAKAMARYGLSAALGLTVGLVAGSRVFGALDHKDAAEAGQSVQGVVYNPEEHKFNPSLNNSDGWHPPMSPETVPSHQDFNMTESATSASTEAATQATAEHASAVVDTHSVTPTGTNSLENVINTDKGMQGHDSIWRSTKDIVKSDPQRFGYTGTPGDADAIAKFTDMKTAELVNQLEQDQGGHLKDLVHNGDKVIVSFEGDKATLSFNPSSGIDAGHLSEIQQSASSAVESGSVEAPNSTGAQAILDNAKAQAEWAKNDYSKFVNGAGEYSSEVYKTALSIQDTGAVNDVVNKVFESSAEVQQQFLHDIDPSHFTGANGKAEIFLKTIAESQKIKLADINSLEELQKHVAAFDRLVADKSLPTNVWTPKLFSDGQGNEIYALVKAKGGLFSFLGEKQYLVDTTVGKPFSVSETGLRNMLENHNVNIDASQNVLTENPPVEPKAEVIEPTAETKIIHEGGIDFASTYSATERASILEYLRGQNMELDDLKNQFAQLARNSSYNQNPNWLKFSDMFKQSLQEHMSEYSSKVADLDDPKIHLTLETTGNMSLEEAANMQANAEIRRLLIDSGVRNKAELAQELLDKEFPVAPELPNEAQFVFKRLSELKEGAVFNDATGDNVFTKINGKIWRYDPIGDPSIEVRDVKDLESLYK